MIGQTAIQDTLKWFLNNNKDIDFVDFAAQIMVKCIRFNGLLVYKCYQQIHTITDEHFGLMISIILTILIALGIYIGIKLLIISILKLILFIITKIILLLFNFVCHIIILILFIPVCILQMFLIILGYTMKLIFGDKVSIEQFQVRFPKSKLPPNKSTRPKFQQEKRKQGCEYTSDYLPKI